MQSQLGMYVYWFVLHGLGFRATQVGGGAITELLSAILTTKSSLKCYKLQQGMQVFLVCCCVDILLHSCCLC